MITRNIGLNERDFVGTILGLIMEGDDELPCLWSTLVPLAVCKLSDGCKVYSKAKKCRNFFSFYIMLIDV